MPLLSEHPRAPLQIGEEPLERELAPVDADGVRAILGGATPPPPPSTTPPQLGESGLRLLVRIGSVDPESLDDYRAHEGYSALRRAIELGPEGVIREIAVTWGTWTYTVTYSNLGSTPPLVAPADAKPLRRMLRAHR